jgi:hypothetical protein
MVVGAELVVGVSGVGGAGLAALGGRWRDPHQAVRIAEGQRPQQQCVHNTEHRNIGADAKRENQDSDERKAAIAAEGAKSVAEILEKNIEIHESSRFAVFVFRHVKAAKADKRLPAGFLGGKSALQILFNGHFQMRGNLCFEISIERRLLQEGTHAGQRPAQRAHPRPPSAGMASTRPITSDNLCQYFASLANCFRPLSVIE